MTPEDEDAAVADQVRAAVTELYAVPAGEFVTRRTALVKAARADRQKDAAQQIGALRKPSVAAWAVNQVVRQRPAVLAHLADVGVRLRHAQSALDASGIAGLRAERDAVLTELVAAAAEVSSAAGQTLTPAVEAEVRDTGIAALADEAAAEVVASGGLTRALHYSGFGEVDIADAVARTSTGVVLTRIEGGGDVGEERPPERGEDAEDIAPEQEPAPEPEPTPEPEPPPAPEPDPAEELRADLDRAERAQGRADKEVAVCTSRLDQARSRSEATRARIEKLRADLAAAEAADEEALGEVTTAMQARKEAVAAQAAASEEVARLRSALDQLT
ncbi:hypothetical protein [Ornithinicoccus hortensis]|uniref:Uncharacterized protein n=1 Tax=Ornithinicoccus hortensis TaxID=82346 RepID=A0A542YM67_9MICO|nr:hypothetical protein [Ornithinicoccus hortensis]TQL49182.1 hypothetical protein FB467_0247 [Ornithinicoccus hortensis]